MQFLSESYWRGTRHPWSCVAFVLPLLCIYEVGLHFLGPTPPDQLRNGADVWLRSALAAVHLSPVYAAPALLVFILFAWSVFYREERPGDLVSIWTGMVFESALFAVALFGLGQGLDQLAQLIRPYLHVPADAQAPEPVVENLVRYLGAGLYEETLFRLLLFSGLLTLLNLAALPRLGALLAATLFSALLFAGAHNLGPFGEPFHAYVFLFRTLAGMFFTWLFCVRGFGIAVGAHAGYDVLVGLIARP
ncbi:MAG: CPBP family glutamic-type intramembrane protease [Gemmataceae bacterium]|nr:CPBP family glutamic-type intramembrane protease [Gemmataceae bacterium]